MLYMWWVYRLERKIVVGSISVLWYLQKVNSIGSKGIQSPWGRFLLIESELGVFRTPEKLIHFS